MKKQRIYIEFKTEDDLRKEFEFLVAHGETKAKTFNAWMRYSRHYAFDGDVNKWYFTA